VLVVFFVAATIVFTEWLRGWVFTGFPWVMLSQTQVPVPALCQIADITGHHGITFWIVACNTMIFLMIRHRANWKKLIPTACGFAAVTLGIVTYGLWRIQQTQLAEGPSILLIQPNFEHARGGAKLVGWEDQLNYHFDRTPKALANAKETPDLIVWSETVMPPMNIEARRKARDPRLARGIHEDLLKLVRENKTSLVFGAYALVKHEGNDREADIRNSTYFYSYRSETQPRYDKVHLVPYGESVPFRDSIRWLHDLMFKIAAYSTNYVITHGSIDALTIFNLPRANDLASQQAQPWRFVTPICFEDTDAALVAKMFRGQSGTKPRRFLGKHHQQRLVQPSTPRATSAGGCAAVG
jgi:apolipoprotein N-acyltransferase